MLSTRTARGLDLAAWRRDFDQDFAATHSVAIGRLVVGGLATIAGGCLQLTEAGMEVQDAVVLSLMD